MTVNSPSDPETNAEFLQVQSEGSRTVSRNRKFYNLPAIIAGDIASGLSEAPSSAVGPPSALMNTWSRASPWTMNGSRRCATSGPTISTNCWNGFGTSGPAKNGFTRKSETSTNWRWTTTPKAEETQEFFSIVQNKLHFAIAGKTPAELIAERADATKPNMGLTSWKGAKVRKGDVTIVKNYLKATEIEGLNRIVSMYLDFARGSGQTPPPDFHARLARKTGCLFAVQ